MNKKRDPEIVTVGYQKWSTWTDSINYFALAIACRKPISDFWTNQRKYRADGTYIHSDKECNK